MTIPTYFGVVVFAITFAAYVVYERISARKYPPGPPGDPVIGNFRTMPSSHAYLYYTKLRKIYGDVVQLQAIGLRVIILGSYEAANQLFGKRGAIYSDRPRIPVTDLITTPEAPPLSSYGPKWKEERRLFQMFMGKELFQTQYHGIIEGLAQGYVAKSIKRETCISNDYVATMARTFIRVLHGIEFESDEDELLQVVLEGTKISSATLIPGRHAANSIPGLMRVTEFITGTSWKVEGEKLKAKVQRMIVEPFNKCKDPEDPASRRPSFSHDMLNTKTTLTEEQIMRNTGSSLTAGLESTAGTVLHFITAMLLHPEIQKRAQEEIDRVIGDDRLPTLADQNDLPYFQALYREVLRWHPNVPFVIPHAVSQDDEYNGYKIPKGTIVISNSWGMSRDESVYPDPESFNPDRFLGAHPQMEPKLYVFGVGRRICPGINFAENAVIGNMLTLLSTVDILPVEGKTPKEFISTGRLVDLPNEFEFMLRPRSENVAQLLAQAQAAQ